MRRTNVSAELTSTTSPRYLDGARGISAGSSHQVHSTDYARRLDVDHPGVALISSTGSGTSLSSDVTTLGAARRVYDPAASCQVIPRRGVGVGGERRVAAVRSWAVIFADQRKEWSSVSAASLLLLKGVAPG